MMDIKVQPGIMDIAPYVGGESGIEGRENVIKLASNEGPFGPSRKTVAALREAAEDYHRYPDGDSREVREIIAARHNLAFEQVICGCGSDELINLLCRSYAGPGDEILYSAHGFAMYPIYGLTVGADLAAAPETEITVDVDNMLAAVTEKTRLVFIANPNNPTGTAVHVDQIRGLLQQVPDDVLVVVDEAYREFTTIDLGDPITDLMPDYPNVVVLRTFSKAYGLAALRTGYGIADPSVVTQIDKVLIPFAVNHLAQAASLAAIEARDEARVIIDRLVSERDRVVDALRSDGWEVPDAHANFVWLPLGERTDEVFPALERRGVVVRSFPGVGIRVTIGTSAENDRFLEVLADLN